jgi:Lysozyme like domain
LKPLLIAASAIVLYWLYQSQRGADAAVGGIGTAAGSTASGILSLQELQNLWTSNGGDPASAPMAAAIAMAESGGDPYAFNGRDPNGGSVGLWQINGIHGSQASYDPNANAAAAVAISGNGTNWNPWGSYTNGSYAAWEN